jgi:glyoxylase-like metal-dependent hydrolase (beta-lactamase superfamily II)
MFHFLAFLIAFLAAPIDSAMASQPTHVASDVYVFLGDPGEPSIENAANTGNSSFLVAPAGVIVIDTGPSYRHGTAMIQAIQRVSDKPIRLVILTHAVQEFLFGNAAFSDRRIPIVAHEKSLDLMRSRCAQCLANLVVYDPRSGVLFTGALVSTRRIPELRDGKLQGWLDALTQLAQIPATAIVPAHGPVTSPSAIADMRAYLLALDAQVRALYDGGYSLLDALDSAELPAFRHWAMYPAMHRRNVQQRYLELELQDLEAR